MFLIGKLLVGKLDQSQIKNNNYLTLAEIKAAKGTEGDICTCIETETIYRYLTDGSEYTPDDTNYLITGDGGDTRWISLSGKYAIYDEIGLPKFVNKGVLTVTGIVAANTTILTNMSGANITKTEDNISLGSNATDFNGNKVLVLYNGSILQNGVEVIYVSEYSFRMPDIALDSGDKIILLK